MKKEYKISDEVWSRVVQAIQEAIMTQTDVTDFLRSIVVEPGEDDELVLTEAYKQQVKAHYDDMLAKAEALQAQMDKKKLILS